MSKKITYPALRLSMGSWTYFSVRMTMKEAAKELYLQRTLRNQLLLMTCFKGYMMWLDLRELTNYLKIRDDRFYGSLIVAPIGKSPSFHSIRADEELIDKYNIGDDANDSIGFVSLDEILIITYLMVNIG